MDVYEYIYKCKRVNTRSGLSIAVAGAQRFKFLTFSHLVLNLTTSVMNENSEQK